MKVYVASSWRNLYQELVVQRLRVENHEVYDFKNPEPENHGFHWSEIDPDWRNWTTDQFVEGLDHEKAEFGFALDMQALHHCDACVLVLPCGRSAHLELGYAVGANKRSIVFCPPELKLEPELMYKMCDLVTGSLDVVVQNLQFIEIERAKGYY